MTYGEMLKHPKWQKKRLEILERDQFACCSCGSKEKTLHVHHWYYERGSKVWEYPRDSLETFCEDCHKEIEEIISRIQRQFYKLGIGGLHKLLGFALGQELFDYPKNKVAVSSYEIAEGIGYALKVKAEKVMDLTINGEIAGHEIVNAKQEGGNG